MVYCLPALKEGSGLESKTKGCNMKKTLLAALLALAGTVQAAKVTSVSVKMSDGSDVTGDVTARCQVKVGDEYDPGQCARDVRALRDAGEYDNITVKVEHGANGIDVIYVVTPKLRFQGPLNVTGNDFWSVSKITSLSELKDGYPYGEADFEAAVGRVKHAYQKKFFPDVKVDYRLEPIPDFPGAVHVTMDITEGERRKIHDFTFVGNDSVDAADLRATFDQYPWWNPLGWFSDTPATEQDLAEARDKVVAYYRDRGYLDVTVSLPEEVPYSEGKVDRQFKVVEGVQYKVGRMSVTGTKQYPADAVLAANKALATGDIAGAATMAEAARQMEIFCGSGEKPLTDTHVTVRQLPSGANPEVVDLEFAVEEGVPVAIHRILVRGNDYTKDKVIRREISLSPGDPMLADKAEQGKRRLENLRYFDRVRYYMETVEGGEAKDGQPEQRDLVYEVSEKNTGNFMVGIGASSVDSVYGMVELSESNFDLFSPWRFRGAGQKGRVLLQAGPRVQTYEASVTEPYLFDRMLELTVTGYRRQRWYDDYDIIRSGGAATLAYPVKFWPTWEPFGRFVVRFGGEFIEFDDVEKGLWTYRGRTVSLREEDRRYGDAFEPVVRLFWARDTRDSFRMLTTGARTQIYVDFAPAGDNKYYRAGFNHRNYFNVWKKYNHVFMAAFRAETIDGISDDVPIYDRMFLGGPRTIRGFEYRHVSPFAKRVSGHDDLPWGGQTLFCANFEYTIPIVRMLRLALFSDLGSVGEDEFDTDFSDTFAWSAGVGFRIDLPMFPIRLDFAAPLKTPDEAEKEVFSFTVGYDF